MKIGTPEWFAREGAELPKGGNDRLDDDPFYRQPVQQGLTDQEQAALYAFYRVNPEMYELLRRLTIYGLANIPPSTQVSGYTETLEERRIMKKIIGKAIAWMFLIGAFVALIWIYGPLLAKIG